MDLWLLNASSNYYCKVQSTNYEAQKNPAQIIERGYLYSTQHMF